LQFVASSEKSKFMICSDFSDFYRKNKESCQLENAFSVICYEFAAPSQLSCQRFKIYFTIKGLISE
jgi:hypothetical protein